MAKCRYQTLRKPVVLLRPSSAKFTSSVRQIHLALFGHIKWIFGQDLLMKVGWMAYEVPNQQQKTPEHQCNEALKHKQCTRGEKRPEALRRS